LLLLVLEEPRLRPDVLLERDVPVEVIGGQVQHHADVGAKCLDGLELKTAHLRHRDRQIAGGFHARKQRRADVATHEHRNAGGLQDVADERGRRRLAVRPGDRHQPPAQKTPRQLDFAPYRNSPRARFRE